MNSLLINRVNRGVNAINLCVNNTVFRGTGQQLLLLLITTTTTSIRVLPIEDYSGARLKCVCVLNYTVSQKTSPMFLAITRESIVGFS